MRLLKIGITHGDINGIGYELLLKALQAPEMLDLFTPVIFGSEKVAEQTAIKLEMEPLHFHVIASAAEAENGCINLVSVCHEAEPEVQFGKQTEAALQAEANSLTAALAAYREGQIDALVTLPGHLDNDETSHSLTDFIRRVLDAQDETFEWTLNGPLRILSIQQMDVSTELGAGLASESFQSRIKAIADGMRRDFGVLRPRLAVISAQPKVRFDIEELHEQGVMAFGPFDANTFVEAANQLHYDGCILQGEMAAGAQMLSQEDTERTIGYVSGLPLVLTYPLLGIDYEHAGQGEANEASFRQAIFTAIDIVRSRVNYGHATRHPLEKQWVPRGRDDFKLDLTKEE